MVLLPLLYLEAHFVNLNCGPLSKNCLEELLYLCQDEFPGSPRALLFMDPLEHDGLFGALIVKMSSGILLSPMEELNPG